MASPVTVVHSDVSGSGTAFSGSGFGNVVVSVGWSSGLLDEDIVGVDLSAVSLKTSVGGTLGFVFRANINGLSGAPASLYGIWRWGSYHFTVVLFVVLFSVVAVKGYLTHRTFYFFSFGLTLTKHGVLK